MTRHPLLTRCGYSQFNLSGEGLTSSRWHHCRLALLSAKIIKDATLKIYPGAGHGLMTTHKEQFNADLLTFLKS